jgi:hypothetical protein
MDADRIREIMLEADRDGRHGLAESLARCLQGYITMGLVPRNLSPDDAYAEARDVRDRALATQDSARID